MQRLLQLATYTLLALLPFQTRYIFHDNANPFAVTSIYAFDIVLMIVAALWLWQWYHSTHQIQNRTPLYLGVTVAVLAVCSTYFADNREVALHYVLHFLAGLSLIAIIATSRLRLQIVLWIFLGQAVLQSVVAIAEFMGQWVPASSILGVAQQLPMDSGVAVVATATGRFLRSYALLPHPNIAAGVIVLGMVASYFIHHYRYAVIVCLGIASLGLAFTFSRSALIAYIIFLLFNTARKARQYHLVVVSLGVLVSCFVYLAPLYTSRLDTSIYTEQISISERSTQLQQALALLPRYWPQGTGLGQYTLLAANGQMAQPLHFVPGLMWLELGLVTVLLWYGLIATSWWQQRKQLLQHPAFYLGLVLLLVGCFDHYPFTNISLFWLWCSTIGLVYVTQHEPKMAEAASHHEHVK